MKDRRHAREIIAALVHLGCRLYSEDEVHYWVSRPMFAGR